MNGEPLEIYGDGSQTRDFIFIDDLIDAIYKAATFPSHPSIGGEIFQIATNKETTVAEMTEMLAEILKENSITDFQVINGEERVGDVMRNFSDTSKAKKKLGWHHKNELSDGLNQTVSWFFKRR